MPDDSPILHLPYILPSQAQKHVTHNEALRILDVCVQLVVLDRTLTAPPAGPVEGDRHIVATPATGPWIGREGQIALFENNVWSFFLPQIGWQAYVRSESAQAVFTGAGWTTQSDGPFIAGQIGVSATPDATNRLSVSAPATLLNHAGNGHQLKINKASDTDTASLLFQSGFSGRAEMGLSGNNNFAVKVSPDGTAFSTGLSVAAATGVVTVPSGLLVANGTLAAPGLGFGSEPDLGLTRISAGQMGLCAGGAARAEVSATTLKVSVPVTGTAITQSAADVTAGRLLKVGDFGLGSVIEFSGSIDDPAQTPSGFLRVMATATGTKPAGVTTFNLLTLRRGTVAPYANTSQIAVVDTTNDVLSRSWNGTAWTGWSVSFRRGNILGTVSQTGGVPTGGVIERGSNANGDYTRFADGTQICRVSFTSSATAAVTRTFPAAFSAAPTVSAMVGAGASRIATWANRTAVSVDINVFDSVGARQSNAVDLTVTGPWF